MNCRQAVERRWQVPSPPRQAAAGSKVAAGVQAGRQAGRHMAGSSGGGELAQWWQVAGGRAEKQAGGIWSIRLVVAVVMVYGSAAAGYAMAVRVPCALWQAAVCSIWHVYIWYSGRRSARWREETHGMFI